MRQILLLCLCLSLAGCFTSQGQAGVQQVVLLPEDRVFTLAQGTTVDLLLDKKPIKMTFPTEMKIVSPSYLVRQEQVLNNTALGKANADKKSNMFLTILGSVLALGASAGGAIFKAKADQSKALANLKVGRKSKSS
jgi:hypothetical protein